MNPEQDNPLHELSGLYALDALEGLDRSRFEKHLATCAECRLEVAEFRETMAQLASMDIGTDLDLSDDADLPPALRATVLSRIDAMASSPDAEPSPSRNGQSVDTPRAPFGRVAGSASARRPARSGGTRVYVAIAAAAAIVAVVIGFAAIRADDPADDYALLAELRARGATSVTMVGNTTASVELVREADGNRAIVVATNLGQVSPDQAYQAWIIKGSEVRPASVFVPHDDGRAILLLDDVPDDVETIAVTIEPKGGSTAPTSEVVFAADVT